MLISDFPHMESTNALLQGLKVLPVNIDGVKFRSTEFDDNQSKLLLNRLLEEGERDDLVIVQPDIALTHALLILTGMIGMLKMDILAKKEVASLKLGVGQPVGLIVQDYIYVGYYEGEYWHKTFGNMHKVRRNDGVIHSIRNKDSWKIHDFKVLEDFDKSKKGKLYGAKIEELLGISRGSLLSNQRSKALIVTARKEDLIKELRSIEIAGEPFEKIFPAARSIGEKLSSVGVNELKREPLILFASDLSSAADMVKQDESIRLIIVVGNKSHDIANITYINGGSVPRKIIMTLKSEDYELLEALDAQNFDAWVWHREDFKGMTATPEVNTGIIKSHYDAIGALTNSEIVISTVEIPESLEKCITEIYATLRKIQEYNLPSRDIDMALAQAYSFTKSLIQLPVNGVILDIWKKAENIENSSILIDAILLNLKSALNMLQGNNSEACDRLRLLLNRGVDLLNVENLKQDFINNYEEEHPNEHITFSSPNRLYNECLTKVFSERNHRLNIDKESHNSTLLVTGWGHTKSFAQKILAPYSKVVFLGYPSEVSKYRYNIRTLPSGPFSRLDTSTRKRMGFPIENPTSIEGLTSDEKILDQADEIEVAEGKIESIVHEYIILETQKELDSDTMLSPEPQNETDDRQVKIIFQSGETLQMHPKQKVHRLAEDMTTYDYCLPGLLKVGDAVIFANTGRDLFMELMSTIKQDEEYQQAYKTAMKWADSLLLFQTKFGLSDKDLQARLAIYGCNRGLGIIQNWLMKVTISPERQAIEAICTMTNDVDLRNEIEDVIAKGQMIKRLHKELGRMLVRSVLEQAVSGHDDLESSLPHGVRTKIKEYANKVLIKQVAGLARIEKAANLAEENLSALDTL